MSALTPPPSSHARAAVEALAVAALAVALTVDHGAWVEAGSCWLYDDMPNHLRRVVDQGAQGHLPWQGSYPPLVLDAAGLLFRAWGVGTPAWIAAIGAFSLVLALATWGLGRTVGSPTSGQAPRGETAVGWVAAGLVLTLPNVVVNARAFLLDLPGAAWVTLAVLALVRSDGFRRTGWGLLFGLATGLGLLTRQTGPLFLAPALLVPLGQVLVDLVRPGATRLDRVRPLLGLAAAAVLAGAVAWPWYRSTLGENASFFATRILQDHAPAARIPAAVLALQLAAFVQDRLLVPWMVPVAVLGALALPRSPFPANPSPRATAATLLLALVGGFLAISLLTEAQARYYLPLSGLFAVLVARGLAAWRRVGPVLGATAVSLGVASTVGWHRPDLVPRQSLDDWERRTHNPAFLDPRRFPAVTPVPSTRLLGSFAPSACLGKEEDLVAALLPLLREPPHGAILLARADGGKGAPTGGPTSASSLFHLACFEHGACRPAWQDHLGPLDDRILGQGSLDALVLVGRTEEVDLLETRAACATGPGRITRIDRIDLGRSQHAHVLAVDRAGGEVVTCPAPVPPPAAPDAPPAPPPAAGPGAAAGRSG